MPRTCPILGGDPGPVDAVPVQGADGGVGQVECVGANQRMAPGHVLRNDEGEQAQHRGEPLQRCPAPQAMSQVTPEFLPLGRGQCPEEVAGVIEASWVVHAVAPGPWPVR